MESVSQDLRDLEGLTLNWSPSWPRAFMKSHDDLADLAVDELTEHPDSLKDARP